MNEGNMSRERIYEGVEALVTETAKYSMNLPRKMTAMQDIFLKQNKSLYSGEEERQIRYSLKTVNFKFQLFTLNLENLWVISEKGRSQLIDALENSLDKLSIDDGDLLAASLILENLLFQGVAFLEIYMLYLLQILGTGHKGYMSSPKKFFKNLKTVANPRLKEKAKRIEGYLVNNVFGEDKSGGVDSIDPKNWGNLLKSLRDKVAHRDLLRPSFDSDERLIGKVLFDWPTIQGLTFDRFAQSIQNGMFFMLETLSPMLYDLEWKAGPYNPDMW